MRTVAAGNGNSSVRKMFLCFEIKPLVATVLAVGLVMVIWNLQPYYESLLSCTCHCSSSSSISTVGAPPALPISLLLNTTLQSTAGSASSSTRVAEEKKLSGKTTVRAIPNATNTKTIPVENLDPNKREFHAYGNAAALFVQMGAYRGGPTSFSVIGLASKPIHVFGSPWYKCEWISSNGTSTKSKATKILPDWGYGRVYTVVVVNCTFATNPNIDNSGGKLNLYAYYGASPKKFEKFTALEEAPGTYDDSKYHPPYPYEYLYCGSSLYGNISAARIREWMAYHTWFFGPKSHFVFHDAGGMTSEVRAVLDPWVKAGRATIQDIRDQEQYDGYYYNQFLVVNDCLHRYRFSANWTFYFDVDEYIFLPNGGKNLGPVMKEFSDYTQFTIEQNSMNSKLCLNDSTHEYTRQWGFEKLVFRDARKKIRRDRKYAIQAKNAFATGVHMSENVVGNTLHKTESKIRYYHYHNSIQVKGEPCRVFLPPSAKRTVTWLDKLPYVYDDSMKKIANTIKQFELQSLSSTKLS